MELKDRIKYFREQKGWNKSETAKKVGVSVGAYSNWEYGNRKPSRENISDLAKVFGVTDYYLSTGNKTLSDLTEQDISDLDMRTSLKNSFRERKKNFINDLANLDPDEMTVMQEVLLRQSIIFSDFYRYTEEGKFVTVLAAIISQLNRMYSIYNLAENEDDIDESIDQINFYRDDIKSDESAVNLVDNIADYLIEDLKKYK